MERPLVAAMLRPEFYEHRPEQVRLVETHISWVFLAGNLVYKVKKPVDYGFLNYTTLPRRSWCCRREVELNRRLASDLYLGVAAIRFDGRDYHLGGPGKVAEYAVVMRRVPEECLLSRMLEAGRVTSELMADFGRLLAAFHQTAAHGPRVARWGSLAALRRNNEEDFRQTRGALGQAISTADFELIQDYSETFLRRHAALLRRRARTGRVRDGHGDLHAEHLGWLGGRPFALDCIEFTPRFRCADVAAETAFPLMDLEHRGAWWAGRDFLFSYLQTSGDWEILPLLDYFLCYRAYVRGKVNAFMAADDHHAGQSSGREEAQAYFAQAAGYARRDLPPLLVVSSGLTGTGKSAASRLIADQLGFAVISSDVERKRLAGLDPGARVLDSYGTGLYAPEMSERTYAALIERGRTLLSAGRPVVLDASFIHNRHRLMARDLAQETGARLRIMETVCAEELVAARLARRMARQTSISDGRWEIYLRQRAEREEQAGLAPGEYFTLDTAGAKEDRYAPILRGLYPLRPLEA